MSTDNINTTDDLEPIDNQPAKEEVTKVYTQNREEMPGGSALGAAAVGRSATDAIRSQLSGSSGRMANTGTNVSYEGPTTVGGGLGTGYTSGQSGINSNLSTHSAYQDADLGKESKNHKENKEQNEDENAPDLTVE